MFYIEHKFSHFNQDASNTTLQFQIPKTNYEEIKWANLVNDMTICRNPVIMHTLYTFTIFYCFHRKD